MNKKIIAAIIVFVVVLAVLVIVTVTLSKSNPEESNSVSIADAFKTANIVPGVIEKAPNKEVMVVYGNSTVVKQQELSKEVTATEPKVSWSCEEGKMYTLAMTDPDAPSPLDPKLAEYRHWLVINIGGCDVSKGTVNTPYRGPSPPTGTHRYIFLVYEQNSQIDANDVNPQERSKWKVQEFASKRGLEIVAGNFFTVKSNNK